MKRITLITICLLGIYAYAQTPYDSFAPEVSEPMLGLKEPVDRPETIQYAIVADMQCQTLLLVDVSCGEVIATEPISDHLSKWISVDPLADKYPGISPYAYLTIPGYTTFNFTQLWSTSQILRLNFCFC